MPIPSLPVELLSKIFSFLPADSPALPQLSLVSKTFHDAVEPALYTTPHLSSWNELALPHLNRSLQVNAKLGSSIRALRLQGGEWDLMTTMKLLISVLNRCEQLEELSLEGMAVKNIADLLAIPKKLRLLNLFRCNISKPSTSAASPPPPTTIKYLAIEDCSFNVVTLPPKIFPSLISFSLAESSQYGLQNSSRFLFSLPSTLKALRIVFGTLWYYMQEYSTPSPSRQDWEKAFGRWTGLEHFETDMKNMDFRVADGEATALWDLISSGKSFKSLKVYHHEDDNNWEGEVTDWIGAHPKWLEGVQKIGIFELLENSWGDEDSFNEDEGEDTRRKAVRGLYEQRGIQLKVEKGSLLDVTGTDPFWTGFITESRSLEESNVRT